MRLVSVFLLLFLNGCAILELRNGNGLINDKPGKYTGSYTIYNPDGTVKKVIVK